MGSEAPGTSQDYAPLGEALSQGDICRDVPWGVIPSPLVICRPDQPKQPMSKAFCGQVDLINRGGKAYAGRHEMLHFDSVRGLVMVVWDDCEIDKFENRAQDKEKWFAAVAPIHPLARLNPGDREVVMRLERHAFFPLLASPEHGIADASYVDLRYIVPVKRALLDPNRVTALSTTNRKALVGHMIRFLTGTELAPACPNCGTELSHIVPAAAQGD